jgi:hypothetical protein
MRTQYFYCQIADYTITHRLLRTCEHKHTTLSGLRRCYVRLRLEQIRLEQNPNDVEALDNLGNLYELAGTGQGMVVMS